MCLEIMHSDYLANVVEDIIKDIKKQCQYFAKFYKNLKESVDDLEKILKYVKREKIL